MRSSTARSNSRIAETIFVQVKVGSAQRGPDGRLDDRLVLERLGHPGPNGIDGLVDRGVLAKASLFALGTGGREQVISKNFRTASDSAAERLALSASSRA